MSDQLAALDALIEAVEVGSPSTKETWYNAIGDNYHAATRAANGSLDAAKALHDALLPGWRMDALWQGGVLSRTQDVWHCRIRCIIDGRTAIDTYERVGYDTPARAWLLAILRAHRTQIGGAA